MATSRVVAILVLITLHQVVGQEMQKPKEVSACQTELKVTDHEMAEFMDKDVQYSRKIECFIKCLGEKFGVFKDGALVESKVLEEIKSNTKGNEAAGQKEIAIYNECKTKKAPNGDACSTAALIYKCVRSAALKMKL